MPSSAAPAVMLATMCPTRRWTRRRFTHPPHLVAGQVRVGRDVAGLVREPPEIALARGQRHRVPVDEHVTRAGPHHVPGMRLAVRDHPRCSPPLGTGGQTVGQR